MKKLPDVLPFKGIRYNIRKISDMKKVVAPPYDVISPEGRKMFLARDPNNIIRLILPNNLSDVRDEDYRTAAETLAEWQRDEVLVRDPEPSFYLYEETFEVKGKGKWSRRGFLGLCRLEELGKGRVLPHENTLPGPKVDRFELMKACGTNLSPIFSLYSDPERVVEKAFSSHFNSKPEFEISDDDRVRHRFWRVSDRETLKSVTNGMEGKKLYIADGHHRFETSVVYRDWVLEKHPDKNEAPFHYTLMFFCPMNDPGLVVFPTHRMIQKGEVPPLSEIRKKLKSSFEIEFFKSQKEDEFLARLAPFAEKGHAFGLVAKEGLLVTSWNPSRLEIPLSSVDTAVLHEIVLHRILGLSTETQRDKKTVVHTQDERLVLRKVADGEALLGAILNPIRMNELQEKMEAGVRLPPKSTYFYPKLLSGLVLNPLYPGERVAT